MDTILNTELYKKLESDKIKINWNKNPIPMEKFLSFLTVPYERSHNHLGASNGWTRLYNHDHKLEIGGGIVNGVEYLDSIQYGYRKSNPYNNYVNPFYMFDILSDDGKKFFIEYYKSDIEKIISEKMKLVDHLEQKLNSEKGILDKIQAEFNRMEKGQ